MNLLDLIHHSKKNSRLADYEDAASVIEAFVDGRSEKWAWDEFTSIKKKDPFLESVRVRCLSVYDNFPAREAGCYCSSEGFGILRGLAKEVREKTESLQIHEGA